MEMDNDFDLTEKQARKALEFIFRDDMTIFEKEMMDMSDSEQLQYLKNNPDFLSDYVLTRDEKGVKLLQDETFRGILRRIKSNKESEAKKEETENV